MKNLNHFSKDDKNRINLNIGSPVVNELTKLEQLMEILTRYENRTYRSNQT